MKWVIVQIKTIRFIINTVYRRQKMSTDYFKGFKLFKMIQLAILVIFAIMFFAYIYFDESLRNSVYTNKSLLTICVFLWAFMIYSIICIILDFFQLEGHIVHDNVLNKAVYTDTLTGIPNRFGCDMIFEEYSGLKDISKLGCAVIKIANLDAINHENGRSAGNVTLVDFSKIIEKVGADYGFVGRNNGNEFLAVIDNCSGSNMSDFFGKLEEEIDAYNKVNQISIEISKTNLLNEEAKAKDFNELIEKLYNLARG